VLDPSQRRRPFPFGGIGATGSGEAFGGNYELPNMTAYNETCAAIGNDYWNHRLFLLHADAKYIDVMERTLYNGLISGVSLDGKTFFYPNPLESNGQHARSPWFGVACCPGNITRFMASVPGYVYAQKGDAIWVNLYMASSADVSSPLGFAAFGAGCGAFGSFFAASNSAARSRMKLAYASGSKTRGADLSTVTRNPVATSRPTSDGTSGARRSVERTSARTQR